MSDGVMLRVKSFIRGYHEYMDIWVPNVEDKYQLKRKPDNKKDPNAVAIVRPGPREENHLGNDHEVLGHVPKLMAIWLTKFLKRGTNDGKAVVKGKRINRGGGYGLEVPCEYHFTGDKFSITWLETKLQKEGFECN